MSLNISETAFLFAGGNMVINDPGFIVGPMAAFFGSILNFIFNFVNSFTAYNALGISIVLLTLFTIVLMIPLSIKMQKSMVAMQKLSPEMMKIRKKYEGDKSRETQQKMNAEVQALYSKNKVNPLGGCLPIVVQMPIFIALNFIMQQSYRYVTEIGAVFNQISEEILSMVEVLGAYEYLQLVAPHFRAKIPNRMWEDGALNAGVAADVETIVSRFSHAEWSSFIADMPADMHATMYELVAQKDALELFFGINLGQLSGVAFPGIVIPILAAVTTFLSSYFMTKLTASMSTDPTQKQMQKIMLFAMPLMLGFFTVQMAAGVGVYWITSSVFRTIQQIILNRIYFKPSVQAKS